jgi:hypothetical protein
VLVAYTLEVLPYKIRAKGFAVMVISIPIHVSPLLKLPQNLTVFLTSAFNQFVNPWAIGAIGWLYYLVYLGWLAVELIFIYFYIGLSSLNLVSEPPPDFRPCTSGNQRLVLFKLGVSGTPPDFRPCIGRTLEETAILFDGEDRRDDLAHMGGEAATTHLSRAIALQDRTHSSKEEEMCAPPVEHRRHSMASAMTTESSMNWLKREEIS